MLLPLSPLLARFSRVFPRSLGVDQVRPHRGSQSRSSSLIRVPVLCLIFFDPFSLLCLSTLSFFSPPLEPTSSFAVKTQEFFRRLNFRQEHERCPCGCQPFCREDGSRNASCSSGPLLSPRTFYACETSHLLNYRPLMSSHLCSSSCLLSADSSCIFPLPGFKPERDDFFGVEEGSRGGVFAQC